MSTTTKEMRFQCVHDCRMEGCPGHTMKLSYYHTSDTVGMSIDGDERFVLEDGAWGALLKLEREMHEYLTRKP